MREAVAHVSLAEDLIAESVRRHIEVHRDHIRGRALADLADVLEERAAWLRSRPPGLDDPLIYALNTLCNTDAGIVHAFTHIVAAVALEAIATQLSLGYPDQTREEETRGDT